MLELTLVVGVVVGSCVVTYPAAHASDGDPLPGFGVGGIIHDTIVPGASLMLAKDAVVQPDGKTVAVGVLSGLPPAGPGFAQRGFVVRYLPNGQRDPGFGSNGVTFFAQGNFSQPEAVAILPNGQILVAGFISGQTLWRLDANGTIDPSFTWTGGVVWHLVPEPDGAVIVLVDAPGNGAHIIARRLDPSGQLDSTYSGDLGNRFGSMSVTAGGVALAPDGRLIIAAEVLGPPTQYCAVVALGSDGRVDTSFASDGVLIPLGTGNNSCRVAVEPDGNILVPTAATNAAPFQASTVMRLAPNGTILSSALLALPSADTPLAVEGTGRLITAGRTSPTSASVSAYLPDGSPAIGFGGPATNTWSTPSSGSIDGVSVASGGSILAWGVTGNTLDIMRLSSPAGLAPQPPVLPLTRFVPVAPTRILDTRDGTGAPKGKVAAQTSISLQVTGVGGGATDNVSAVVLNVTTTETTGPGYITAYPTGAAQPLVSNLNVGHVNETVANLVTVKVGSGGRVSLFTQGGGQLIADVAGYYEPAGPVSAGRFIAAITPQRLLDTREGVGAPIAKPVAGQTVDLQVLGNSPVPPSGVAAVVLNLTATEATADGYVTVWPTGLDRPVVSNLNVVAGETRANLVIVPLGRDGKVSVFTQSGTHLLADVAGWFTDSTAPVDTVGRFVPVTPTRVLDTRRMTTTPYPSPTSSSRVVGGGSVVPPGAASAVALNATTVGSIVPGFVTLWPGAAAQPVVSNINVSRAAQVVPNAAIVRLGNESFSFYLQGGGHLIADVAGWFTAS